MTLNLHELANMPGAGKAQDAIRKAGYWQEMAGTDDQKLWDVEFEVTMTGRITMQVRASCEEGARELAKRLAPKHLDTHDFQDEKIEDWRVREIDPASRDWGDSLGPEDAGMTLRPLSARTAGLVANATRDGLNPTHEV